MFMNDCEFNKCVPVYDSFELNDDDKACIRLCKNFVCFCSNNYVYWSEKFMIQISNDSISLANPEDKTAFIVKTDGSSCEKEAPKINKDTGLQLHYVSVWPRVSEATIKTTTTTITPELDISNGKQKNSVRPKGVKEVMRQISKLLIIFHTVWGIIFTFLSIAVTAHRFGLRFSCRIQRHKHKIIPLIQTKNKKKKNMENTEGKSKKEKDSKILWWHRNDDQREDYYLFYIV